MFGVAHGILALGDVDRIVVHHLYVAAPQYALVLAGDHVADPRLAGVEVVAQLMHVVGLVPLGHLRPAYPLALEAVVSAPGIDRPGLHVVLHVVGRELHVLVLDRHVAVIVYLALSVAEDLDHGIPGRREHRHLERALRKHGKRVCPAQGISPVYRITACERRGVGSRDLLLYAHAVGASAPSRTRILRRRHTGRQGKDQCQQAKYVYSSAQMPKISYIRLRRIYLCASGQQIYLFSSQLIRIFAVYKSNTIYLITRT